MLLRARGLVVGPLAGVDLDLGPGLTVVVGEDGCGTSTLLRVLAGVQEPDAGTVEGAACALLPAPPGEEWNDHDQAADALDAPHLVGREMWTMSGGERQRVRLAGVLADPAPVLLLDEPLGYLDKAGIRTALMALQALAAQGRALLVVSKSVPQAAAEADRVLVLADGRLS